MTKEISGKDVRQQTEEMLLKFTDDTLTSVSFQTAQQLVEVMESDSLEVLIQLLLRNLAAETGVIPTSRLVAYPLKSYNLPSKLKVLSGDVVPHDEVAANTDPTLEELMSGVTEENKHSHIDFGKRVGQEKL